MRTSIGTPLCTPNAANLTTFNYLSNTVRVVEIDGQPWFIAADVCRVLGLDIERRGVSNHISRLPVDELRIISNADTPDLFAGKRGYPRMNAVSESGLYRLIMRSDKPEARQFQDWVIREVLPAIRKDGMYVAGEEKVKTGEMSASDPVVILVSGYSVAHCAASWTAGWIYKPPRS
jgi:prophage antirepressor-like protein